MQFEFDPPLTQCALCSSNELKHWKKDLKGIQIDKCRSCGLQFMNPQYTDAYLNALYAGYQDIDHQDPGFPALREARAKVHHFNLAQIEAITGVGKFYSVGTGKGIDLEVALERGWEAEGQEVDEEFVKVLSERLSIPVHAGDFAQLSLEANSYDCVYMNHVLEHPKNPGDYLKQVQHMLRPGGILYIACPNIGGLADRVKNVTEALKLRKNVAKHYDTWHHLFYYVPHLLKRVMEAQYGFEVVYIGNDKRYKKGQEQINKSWLDGIPYRSSFRMLARKKGSETR